MAVLEVRNLNVEFRLDTGVVRAVNDATFSVEQGKTLAIVGESGSGKTATALSTLRLNPEPPCFYTGGEILFEGQDLLTMNERQLRQVRGQGIAMIFQDPMTSLNPVRTVGRQIVESVVRREKLGRAEAKARAVQALREVGIANPEERAGQYPHQFSGGMRQRVMIAMALASRPKVLIADEPTTALDVTVQAQIMELLDDLKTRFDMGIVLITHDLAMVSEKADDVLVMYAGRPVEKATAEAVFATPRMPYTMQLMQSAPRADRPKGAVLDPIPGSPPDLLNLPPGCPFEPRCFLSRPECTETVPRLVTKTPGHEAACILSPDELATGAQTLAARAAALEADATEGVSS
ncbi:ABC transporter ATP-binding protein [Aeromicrobium chenweiae]|uniref:Peptide ABC transporter ATP-binding protein n=1 Tax=Aeromicrobium chenweiae TaxID=2079793 RepID=A0A2S0WHZ1_9ACTN|nr:ABC transporter ATP-binding protein [Aeromicrobium chenweiae]AWB90850.1 peptide ABC transporter ATP-binding protein [Aeromicrobium chenweiae]TGN31113.1 ABC transporter ATP-binding protein [Aeromicrobium chenweiae]